MNRSCCILIKSVSSYLEMFTSGCAVDRLWSLMILACRTGTRNINAI